MGQQRTSQREPNELGSFLLESTHFAGEMVRAVGQGRERGIAASFLESHHGQHSTGTDISRRKHETQAALREVPQTAGVASQCSLTVVVPNDGHSYRLMGVRVLWMVLPYRLHTPGNQKKKKERVTMRNALHSLCGVAKRRCSVSLLVMTMLWWCCFSCKLIEPPFLSLLCSGSKTIAQPSVIFPVKIRCLHFGQSR